MRRTGGLAACWTRWDQGRLLAARGRVALDFIGLPFVVRRCSRCWTISTGKWRRPPRPWARTLAGLDAGSAGPVLPAALTGVALAFARAVGEYGSVVFIAGNMPMKTEIAPLLIVTKLEQFDYAGATAIAVVMLAASFVLLLTINLLQVWSGHRRKNKGRARLGGGSRQPLAGLRANDGSR